MCRSLGLDWRGPKLGICMYATAVQCWLRRLVVRGCFLSPPDYFHFRSRSLLWSQRRSRSWSWRSTFQRISSREKDPKSPAFYKMKWAWIQYDCVATFRVECGSKRGQSEGSSSRLVSLAEERKSGEERKVPESFRQILNGKKTMGNLDFTWTWINSFRDILGR